MKLNKIIVAFMLVVIAFGMVACGGKATSIVGKWDFDTETVMKLSGIDTDSLSDLEKSLLGTISMSVEFFEDNTATMTVSAMGQTETETFSYEEKNGKLNFNGEESEYEIKGDTLTIYETAMTLKLTRSK